MWRGYLEVKIEHLKEFLTLARFLNYRAAAEDLYISESSLSRHITLIEEELGARLLMRNTQRVELTSAGVTFFHKIQNLLSQYDDICEEVKLSSRGYERSLRIGFPYYNMHDYLGQAPLHFSNQNKDVMLSFFASTPDKCIDSLLQNSVDAIIMAQLPFRGREKLTFHSLFKEPLIIMMSTDNPLAKKSRLTLDDLRSETFISTDSRFADLQWSYYANIFAKFGFFPEPPVKFKQIENVLAACRNGLGVSIQPWCMRSQKSHTLTFVPLDNPKCFRKICLIHRTGNDNPAIPAFLRAYETIGEYGWPETAPNWVD